MRQDWFWSLKLSLLRLESTGFQPVSQPKVPRFVWSSDCASMRSRGCTAVLELLATSARAIIIAADPGRRARRRGLPGGAAQEKIDVREIFGLVRFYTDDYLPVVFFTKRDYLFAFGHRLHANYRRAFIGSQLRHSGFSLASIEFQPIGLPSVLQSAWSAVSARYSGRSTGQPDV